jgi:hypothetical protein
MRDMRTISFAAVLLAAATAHGAPSIELTVSGSIDAGIVATSIASELSRPVTPVAANAACHAPCLAIAVAKTAGTVTFTTAEGGTRQRTIELGSDHAQWTTMLTLLAGNLVRDEASELLDDTAPAPEPAPVVEAPVMIREDVPIVRRAMPQHHVGLVSIGLVPGLSTELIDREQSHRVTIGLVANSTQGVTGIAISGAVDYARSIEGAQISGAVAVAGDLTGVQLAGAVTVADRAGTQIAGAVSLAHRADVQIAGAVAAADVVHTQISGAVAYAERSDVQIAGSVSITGMSTGFQLAPINVAGTNTGIQLGVINIASGGDGESFGLINIVKGGRTDVEASVDSDQIGTVMLRHGSSHWHNVYGFGGQHVDTAAGMPNNDVWMYGLGLGPSFHIMGLPTDIDVIAWEVNHGDRHENHVSLLNQARLTIGVPIGPVTLVAGGAINAYVSSDHDSPFITARTTTPTDPMDTSVTVKVWPSVFVGARI